MSDRTHTLKIPVLYGPSALVMPNHIPLWDSRWPTMGRATTDCCFYVVEAKLRPK
jgi:hypothetical protein